MPCNAIATASARVNLGALAEANQEALENALTEACQKKFSDTRIIVSLGGNKLVVYGMSRYMTDQVIDFAKKALAVLQQQYLAAKVKKMAKVNTQQVAPNGAIVMEVEL